ncbi:hypothetical protein LINGRAHAP2_LOCUS1710 [Linum grandiflorum]
MIVMAWDSRGLGNPRAVRVLGELVTTHRPDIVFLSETLVGSNKLEEIRVKVGFEGCFAVAARGHSGGVCMLWRCKEQLRLIRYGDHFIDTEVQDTEGGICRVTGFYGCAQRKRRQESWDILRNLVRAEEMTWCVVGDFNDILHQHEQRGRHERPQ